MGGREWCSTVKRSSQDVFPRDDNDSRRSNKTTSPAKRTTMKDSTRWTVIHDTINLIAAPFSVFSLNFLGVIKLCVSFITLFRVAGVDGGVELNWIIIHPFLPSKRFSGIRESGNLYHSTTRLNWRIFLVCFNQIMFWLSLRTMEYVIKADLGDVKVKLGGERKNSVMCRKNL